MRVPYEQTLTIISKDEHIELQLSSGLSRGMSVEVMQTRKDYAGYWSSVWATSMNYTVGRIFRIANVSRSGIQLDNEWFYPFFVLRAYRPTDVKRRAIETCPYQKLLAEHWARLDAVSSCSIEGKDIARSINWGGKFIP